MYLFISPNWVNVIVAFFALILGIATFIQANRTKTLTHVVAALSKQTQELKDQAKSLQNMVTLMAQDQITKHIPTLSDAKNQTKSNEYHVKLNNADALIYQITPGFNNINRNVELICPEINQIKSQGETFEFYVVTGREAIKKGDAFDFFIHTKGTLGMEFTQYLSLVADKDYNPEKERHNLVYFNFKFSYPMPLAQSID